MVHSWLKRPRWREWRVNFENQSTFGSDERIMPNGWGFNDVKIKYFWRWGNRFSEAFVAFKNDKSECIKGKIGDMIKISS